MNDAFEIRIRSAATAGWWTLLIAAGFLTLQWIAYLFLMFLKPAWLLSLWGPGISWDTLGHDWFWLMAIFKFCLWLLALPVLWLTLWSRRLRKR
ncbi:MAG TPA: hypothetical protein VMG30_05645 [Acidobacteriota bacterium]|nr:hypothetical protein [Acidobacteriota bacterium]